MRNVLLLSLSLLWVGACGGSDDGTSERHDDVQATRDGTALLPDGAAEDAPGDRVDTKEPPGDVPAAPDLPAAPDVPAPADVPVVPDVPGMPDVPVAPEDVPVVPDVPGMPDVPLAPEDVPVVPEDVPVVPEDVPVAPDVPAGPDTPGAEEIGKCGDLGDCIRDFGQPGPCQVMYCEENACIIKPLPDGAECTSPSCSAPGSCRAGRCDCPNCVPSCGTRVCGDDGCGGSCGTCPGAPCECINGACRQELVIEMLCSNTLAYVPSGWPIPIILFGRTHSVSPMPFVFAYVHEDGDELTAFLYGVDRCGPNDRTIDVFGQSVVYVPPADGTYTLHVADRPDRTIEVGGGGLTAPPCDVTGCAPPLEDRRWLSYLWLQGGGTASMILPPLGQNSSNFLSFEGTCRDWTATYETAAVPPASVQACGADHLLFGEGPPYTAEAARCAVPWDFLLYLDLWQRDGFFMSTARGMRVYE